jgi:diacylglycerol O-acyltransferase
MSLRSRGQTDAANSFGISLCNLATDRDDAPARLEAVAESMRTNKTMLSRLSRRQVLALSAMITSPLMIGRLVPSAAARIPPSFNVMITTMLGRPEQLYWGGLVGNYPLGHVRHGQALVIAVVNNGNNLDVGVVACRRTVPDVEHLLQHLESAFRELEYAICGDNLNRTVLI